MPSNKPKNRGKKREIVLDVHITTDAREYVLDYLAHGFPTQLFEPFTDGDGNLSSRPVYRDGQPVQCREAIERRERMIEQLAAPSAGPGRARSDRSAVRHRLVAEITGRSRRIVPGRADGLDRLAVETRAASANLAEAQAFMDDEKRILVFSDAGGTGRSYHADLGAKNQRLRVHYLLEAGWKADTAIQGLGRSNRTNQAQPPLFRPIADQCEGREALPLHHRPPPRHARRHHQGPAPDRRPGPVPARGQPRVHLRQAPRCASSTSLRLYRQDRLDRAKVARCKLRGRDRFQLTDDDGSLREELPPITTFLNRLLALTIDLQNTLFGVFEDLLRTRIEGARRVQHLRFGVETVTAEWLLIAERRTLYIHPASGAETQVFTIRGVIATSRSRSPRRTELARIYGKSARQCQSGRAAVQVPAPSLMLDDGAVERRVRLVRPMERMAVSLAEMARPNGGRRPDRFAAAGGRDSPSCRNSRKARCTSLPGCCCRSGSGCPMSPCASTGFRPMTASGSSDAGVLAWVAQAVDSTARRWRLPDAFDARCSTAARSSPRRTGS